MTDQAPDVSELIDRLRERVEERRRSGTYDAELEERLQGHFHRIAAHRPPPFDYTVLRTGLAELEKTMTFKPADISTTSGLPGGSALHKTVAKLVSRQTGGVLEQVAEFATAARDLLSTLVEALEHPNSHTHGELVGQVDAIFDRLAAYERTPTEDVSVVAELSKRLQALEEREEARRFNPWFSAARFAENFRGAGEELRERLADLAAEFEGARLPVIDIGCGRGELLELLADLGVTARGIELDAELAASCRSKGLDVDEADAISWLERADDDSLGGVALIQVAEHLTPQELIELVILSRDKVVPGGKVVVETVNPQSLLTFATAFYIDPTHTTPIHPAYLAFLFREAGFSEVETHWRAEVDDAERLEEVDEDSGSGRALARATQKLNDLLYGPQDYAVVAVR